MIYVMDIGNTNIKSALFDGEELKQYWRFSTSRLKTSDEYGITLESMFRHSGIDMGVVTGIIISSVVPTINYTIEHMCRDFFGLDPMMVTPGIKTGINIKYENPRELGSDRICNAVAAYTLFGGPVITIDFGTATSFGAVDAGGAFLGGCICPGIRIASDALVQGTSKLPHFELVKPERVIGRNTIANLQSGLIYGYVGQVNYLIERMKADMNAPGARVVATGGFAHLIATETNAIDHIDGLLTLKGLRMIYEKNGN